MGRNPDYWHQLRATGVCTLCRQPMPDDDEKLAHTECYRRQHQQQQERRARRTAKETRPHGSTD